MTPKTILRSGKQPNSRTDSNRNNTPSGKTTQIPNGQQQKQYSVRENNPIPERTATETTLRSGKQPNSRTDSNRNNTPSGKATKFPNGQQQKQYSVRENNPISERTAKK